LTLSRNLIHRLADATAVAICPPGAGTARVWWRRQTNVAAQRWWRTLADDVTTEQAQASLGQWCALRAGARDTLEKSW
jgi:hypothetical protein